MPGTANDLHGVLDGHRKFLREKDLAPATHRADLARWVREFLFVAKAQRGYCCEQTLDLFIAQVGTRQQEAASHLRWVVGMHNPLAACKTRNGDAASIDMLFRVLVSSL
ncbi:MAG: hypothetical protein ABFD16_13830 [Thermoguttaceae bacterium]|jgi:hypothetical protein